MAVPRARRGVAALALAASAYGCTAVAGLSSPNTDPAVQHCVDGIRDADELDIDCGGKDCLACGGEACAGDGDCESATCTGGTCALPTCSDGVFDGSESWRDCGDPRGALVACPLCAIGVHCFNGCNCETGYCDPGSQTCQTTPDGTLNCDYCKDGVKDRDESDLDCGGAMGMCPGCAARKHCNVASDCASMACNAGVCG
jgi:hypothetical protein